MPEANGGRTRGAWTGGEQVEKVFLQAVTRMTDIVPDIYQKATMKDGWVTLATNLKKGEHSGAQRSGLESLAAYNWLSQRIPAVNQITT